MKAPLVSLHSGTLSFSTMLSIFFLFPFFFPELRSSSCGNPGIPPKGILNGTRFNLGDKIRYRCVTGYVLDGHSLLTCVTNAASVSIWDFPVPICRGEDAPKTASQLPSATTAFQRVYAMFPQESSQ